MKFLVDLPLGGLAKWLRFCGFDADCRRLSSDLPPPAADTYILTRQESLKRLHRPDLVFITAPAPESQLQEVLAPAQDLPRADQTPEPLQPLQRTAHPRPPGAGAGPGAGARLPLPRPILGVPPVPAALLARQPPARHHQNPAGDPERTITSAVSQDLRPAFSRPHGLHPPSIVPIFNYMRPYGRRRPPRYCLPPVRHYRRRNPWTTFKDTAVSGVKRTWCTLWTFTVNTGPPGPDPGPLRHGLRAAAKIKDAERSSGRQDLSGPGAGRGQSPDGSGSERGGAKGSRRPKEKKEKTYQAIAAIREKIRSSCVIPTPEEPGGIEENPPVP